MHPAYFLYASRTQLGAVLWPHLSAAYIDAKLRPAVPPLDGDVDAFRRSSSLGVRLEDKAAKLGFLAASGGAPSPDATSSDAAETPGQVRDDLTRVSLSTLWYPSTSHSRRQIRARTQPS